MLYPLSHWRISVSLNIIAGFSEFVKSKVKNFWFYNKCWGQAMSLTP